MPNSDNFNNENSNRDITKISNVGENMPMYLFAFSALAPLLTLLFSFLLRHWGWGLMDDFTILGLKGGIFQRILSYHNSLVIFGVFRPIYAVHSGIFYSIFYNNPVFFYVFRLFEVCLVMFLWGLAACRLTGKKTSFFLLPAVTLSFHYFYDAFFYLSSQETIGLLFLGLSLNLFISCLDSFVYIPKKSNDKQWRHSYALWISGLICLFFSFWSKEPFVSSGIALGLSFLYLALRMRKSSHFKFLFFTGMLLVVLSFLNAFLLMKFVRSGYSSGYDLSDLSRLTSNFTMWLKKDLLNHLPWILISLFVIAVQKKKGHGTNRTVTKDLRKEWGIVLSVLLYMGFFLILLPWNTNSYYAAPLGLFFAFFVTLLISGAISGINIRSIILIAVCSLMLNQFICQYALSRESTYQDDTYNLMEWINANHDIVDLEGNILCNAIEASSAIPKYVDYKWRLGLGPFQWSTDPGQTINGRKAEYYLYSPRFGNINKNKFKGLEVVFLTDNWIMYHRLRK